MSEETIKRRIEQIKNKEAKNYDKYLNLDTGRFNKADNKTKFKYVNDKLAVMSNDKDLFDAVVNYKPITTQKPIIITENKIVQQPIKFRGSATPRPLTTKPAKRTQALDAKVWQNHTTQMQSTCFICPKLIGRDEVRGGINNSEIKVERFIQGHIRPQKYFKAGEEKIRDHEDNIKPICSACNLEMGKQHMFEYILHKYDELTSLPMTEEIKSRIVHLSNAIKSLKDDKRMIICRDAYIKCSIAMTILRIYYTQGFINITDYKNISKQLSARESEATTRIPKATEIISMSIR